MALMSGFTRQPYPSPAQVRDVNPSPKAVAVINASIEQSVQEFPPATNTGAFFAQVSRGPILPPYGTKDRDYVLRLILLNEYNNLAQAIVAGLIKKFVTVSWIIDGDKGKPLYIPDVNGRMRSIEAVDHYTNVLNNAQFGAGYGVFMSKFLQDFFTQDFGGLIEMIGPGQPTGPITGPVMGIAQLDAGRSYITGNPYFPIMYFSLISGSLHRMHADRILRLVDSPSADERYFNIGLCALSRTVAVQNRQQFMNRYIEGLVDDKPKPGILAISNMTNPQWEKATEKYVRQLQSDQPGAFGKTLVLMGMDVEKEIKVNHMPFSDTPEKFDWVKYTELDVHALAAGFNVDVQEIWELTGRQGMGGTGQSQVLHQKSEAKMLGFLLQSIERLFNGQMLNRSGVTLQYKYNDPVQQENDATIDGQLATTAVNLVATGKISADEFRSYLKNNSERFARALTDDMGDVQGTDNSEGADIQVNDPVDHTIPEVEPAGAAPAASSDQPLMPRQQSKVPAPTLSRQPQPRKGRNRVAGVGHSGGVSQKGLQAPARTGKAFTFTSAMFKQSLAELLFRDLGGNFNRDDFETQMLDLLADASVKSYADGLRDGGGKPVLDDQDQGYVQDFLIEQIDYIDSLADDLEGGAVDADIVRSRAQMWVNKSLRVMYELGRLKADSEGMYRFDGVDGEESCPQCQRLVGQVHSLMDWHDMQLVPRVDTDSFDCGGYRCAHYLVKTDEPESGDW